MLVALAVSLAANAALVFIYTFTGSWNRERKVVEVSTCEAHRDALSVVVRGLPPDSVEQLRRSGLKVTVDADGRYVESALSWSKSCQWSYPPPAGPHSGGLPRPCDQ